MGYYGAQEHCDHPAAHGSMPSTGYRGSNSGCHPAASVSFDWLTPTCLCCRRDFSECKFDEASLAVLHSVTSLTMLEFEQHLTEDDEGGRDQPAPPAELLAAVADLKQHNPVLKVPARIRACPIGVVDWSARPSHSWLGQAPMYVMRTCTQLLGHSWCAASSSGWHDIGLRP